MNRGNDHVNMISNSINDNWDALPCILFKISKWITIWLQIGKSQLSLIILNLSLSIIC